MVQTTVGIAPSTSGRPLVRPRRDAWQRWRIIGRLGALAKLTWASQDAIEFNREASEAAGPENSNSFCPFRSNSKREVRRAAFAQEEVKFEDKLEARTFTFRDWKEPSVHIHGPSAMLDWIVPNQNFSALTLSDTTAPW